MMTAESMPVLRGELKFNEPLSAFTSWRVGGPADRCYRPADLEDLQTFLASLPEDEPLEWIGLGSNLLVRDGGLRGAAISLQKGLNRIEQAADGRIYAQAGATCHYLFEHQRERLLDYVVDYYNGNYDGADIERAFGLKPDDLGRKVVEHARTISLRRR